MDPFRNIVINKHDGLSKYYFNENGSPKIHEKFIIVQDENQSKKKFTKKQLNQNTMNNSCFGFSKWFKKCREMCKF
jgi:hypothetical protein